MTEHNHGKSPEPPTTDKPASVAPRILSSEDLLGGQREVFIKHGKETYRLRCTKQGKLILHK